MISITLVRDGAHKFVDVHCKLTFPAFTDNEYRILDWTGRLRGSTVGSSYSESHFQEREINAEGAREHSFFRLSAGELKLR